MNTTYYENVFPKFYRAKDVANIFEISESKVYSIIRSLNKKIYRNINFLKFVLIFSKIITSVI